MDFRPEHGGFPGTTQQLRDIGRIAAVVNATAQVLAAQG